MDCSTLPVWHTRGLETAMRARACPLDQSIHDLIEGRADRAPDSVAITAPGRDPLTYGRLRAQIHYVVKALNEMGIGRNDRVAIVLPNGPKLTVAVIAVAAGATSAPLNPAYRATEFGLYLSDLDARALIIQTGMRSPAIAAAHALGIPIIELSPVVGEAVGIFTLAGRRGSTATYTGFADPDDVALLLLTSGTTSRPKRVPLTHTNVCSSAHNIRTALKLVDEDRCLNVMPQFHVHGLIGATLSSLSAGASVVCTSGFRPSRFFGSLRDFRSTWYTAVPVMHQAILKYASLHRQVIEDCPIRFVRSSSAPLLTPVAAQLEEVFDAPAIEAYGMTEAAHQISSNPLPPGRRRAGSVGMGAGPDIAIMGESGNVLRAGETGEIVIRGTSVMRGYEGEAETPGSTVSDGWFRTGDRGRMDADGYLFISGRLNEIINRGGEKISPREVDEVLASHPAVERAVTFAVPHAKFGEDVAAAVVLRGDALIAERQLREFASTRLADYKVPRHVVIVNEIPTSTTGKVQRSGLARELGIGEGGIG